MKAGSKYQPLLEYLSQSDRQEITLTFVEIETLLGTALPESARSKRSWWSNRSRGALQASSWMSAGYMIASLDLPSEQVTFRKPPAVYQVKRTKGTLLWNNELIRALRSHMGLTQAELARELGVRQQTISEWEKGLYSPTRATSKHLTLVAEKAAFRYEEVTANEGE